MGRPGLCKLVGAIPAMCPRRLFPRLLAVLLLLQLSVVRAERHDHEEGDGDAARPEGKATGREGGRRDKGDTSLEDVMDDMNAAFRTLRRQVGDPGKNPSSLKLAASMHELARQASRLQPRMVTHSPREEQPALLAAYQERMKELVATIADLEAALKAGKNRAAAEIVEDLRELQRAGHRKFRTDN